MLKRLARRADVKRFNPHSFRHAWAQRALEHGARLEDIGEILGHNDIKTTKEFYTIWDNKRRRKIHQKYGRL